MNSHTPLGFSNQSFGMPVIGYSPFMADKSTQNVYWMVDTRNGSDSNNGKSWNSPFATIAAAVTAANNTITWTNSPWASRNVILVAPGLYAENLTALPYGGAIVGLGNYFDLNGEYGVTVKPASGSPVDCTSIINCTIANIAFQSPDTSVVFQADNFNRNWMENVLIAGLPGASPTTTRGIEVVKDCTGSYFKNITILQCRNGVYVVTDNANQKQITGTVFEHFYIGGADQTGMYFDINCNPAMVWVKDCEIGDGSTTLALGLDDNTGQVSIANTNFTATACDPASADSDSKYNACYLNGSLMS